MKLIVKKSAQCRAEKCARCGVALISVMLIVLAASAIALLSLHIMHNDVRASITFKYNRQAAQAAHQAGKVMGSKFSSSNALAMAAVAQKNAIETAVSAVRSGSKTAEAAWNERTSGAVWTYPADFTKFTGMAAQPPTDTDTANRLGGDLSRPVFQAGSIGNQTLNQDTVAGFSDGDAYCSKSAHVESFGLVGRPIIIHENGDNKYYLLSDLNSRVSGFKREMGVYKIEPTPCQN